LTDKRVLSSKEDFMPDPLPDREQNGANDKTTPSLADQLKQESERLRQLAEQLQAREKALAEMEANYPYYKKMVHGWLVEQSLREVPPLQDDDLDKLVKEEGGQPLADFIDDL
jgi:hypothetical protein